MSSAGAAGRTPQDAPAAEGKVGRRRPVPADLLTIGEVLAELQGDFADVSHSKIRFLEDRGLVSPARTPSGYRKFSRSDVERLRLVLSLQRDHYLPLRVIGEHVAALDAGHAPPPLPGGGRGEDRPEQAVAPSALGPDGPLGRAPRPASPASPGSPAGSGREGAGGSAAAEAPAGGAPVAGGAGAPAPASRGHRLSRAEVVSHAAGDAALVDGLESHGLLARSSSGYPPAAADVVIAAKQLAGFGIEPRHLRALRTAAEREAALVEQVVSPLRRPHGTGGAATGGERRDRAAAVSAELAATLLRLHGSLLHSALDGAEG